MGPIQYIKETLNHTRHHREMQEYREKEKKKLESGGQSKYMERQLEPRFLSGYHNIQNYYGQTSTHNDRI
ncbi:hypothetical protein PROFUN_00971 [Planoprotostelium fungivorum]|uniref:Uncharacterized protein n=1 Tax=Planoprotostelium fungivorum TaxID=1890364 RepID=A0A2P6N4B9_9EUKA|nr:hypothetical protein PROFUN_00971 [Planoprotostelium fungivorum]